jgi:hypothetical protein
MSISKNSGRQEAIVAYVDINMADLASGVDQVAINLPPNAIVIGGDIVATTAFDSTSTDVIDVGDSASENRYLNDGSVHTAIRTALVPTGYVTLPTTRQITVRWVSGGGTPTVGSFRLMVEYYVLERAAFSQD